MWTMRFIARTAGEAGSVLDAEARLLRVVRREVGDVARGEVRHLALHDRVLALPVLVVVHRGDQVVLVLAGEVREFGSGAHTRLAVAGLAGLGLLAADVGIARSGKDRGGEERGNGEGEEAAHGDPHLLAADRAGVCA